MRFLGPFRFHGFAPWVDSKIPSRGPTSRRAVDVKSRLSESFALFHVAWSPGSAGHGYLTRKRGEARRRGWRRPVLSRMAIPPASEPFWGFVSSFPPLGRKRETKHQGMRILLCKWTKFPWKRRPLFWAPSFPSQKPSIRIQTNQKYGLARRPARPASAGLREAAAGVAPRKGATDRPSVHMLRTASNSSSLSRDPVHPIVMPPRAFANTAISSAVAGP